MQYEVEKTKMFKKWFARLKDHWGKARLAVRFDQIRMGNFGDHKDFSSGVSELRFDFGPGVLVLREMDFTSVHDGLS
ncbi:MAG: hypothetical protein FWF31_11990 [Desulfobulbus sp.]|nr:hypothetical protein [Desulfobulbus sp.]